MAWRDLERYAGQGRLFEGTAHVADVEFRLQFRQQMLSAGVHGSDPPEQLGGLIEGSGTFRIAGDRLVNLRAVKLEMLHDGRCIDILVTNSGADGYTFITNGDLFDCSKRSTAP